MDPLLKSSVLILACPDPQLRLLMVRRAPERRTFPNSWMFPGGRLENTDSEVPVREEHPLQAWMTCAVRETFEETGILAGFTGDPCKLPALRIALNQGRLSFAQLCRELDYAIPSDGIINLGRRVTPPLGGIRFDTLYFLMKTRQMPPVALEEAGEHAEGDWLSPAVLLDRWRMGKALMHPPVRDVLETLAREGLSPGALGQLQNLANDPDTLYHRIALHPGIELVPLRTPTLPPATHTNCYLVGDQQFVIVDPGSPYPEEQAVLDQHLEEKIARGQKPQAILLTHHHADHIGGVAHLQERSRLPVAAHPLTAERLERQGITIKHRIQDGELWDLGADPFTGMPWQLKACWTPGHAPGHLCFVDLRHPTALVGDLLAGAGTILIAPPDGHMRTYLESLESLAAMPISLAFPAHGPPIGNSAVYCRYYIQHRLMREKKILAALESRSPLQLAELVAAVYDDLDPAAYPLATQSLLAHLEKLREENHIIQENSQIFLISI